MPVKMDGDNWEFSCDVKGCKGKFVGNRKDIIEKAANDGWSVRIYQHLCPEHNKPPYWQPRGLFPGEQNSVPLGSKK